MVDHMLQNTGMSTGEKAESFVKKYNSSVYFDKNVTLRDHAAQRQANLLDRSKISLSRKGMLWERINNCESFGSSGLSLEVMNLPFFWAGSKVHASTNALWATFGTTTEATCTHTLTQYFAEVDKLGCNSSAKLFSSIGKRALVATKLADEVFPRQHLQSCTIESMVKKVMKGNYDSDVEAMLQDSAELDEHSEREFDEYLASMYSVIEDAQELHASAAASAIVSAEQGPEKESPANMNDSEWVLVELQDSLGRFSKRQAKFEELDQELKREEDKHESACKANANAATENFLNTYVHFPPHVLDKDRFLKELPSLVEDQVEKITKLLGNAADDVIIAFFADLSSFGTATASVREEVEMQANVACGKKGLALIMASETPSGRGRPTPKKSARQAASADAGAPPSALQGLPAAESNYQDYKDKAQLRRLLSKDFQQLFSLGGGTEERYAEPVSFKRANKHDARAMAILPAANSPWLAMSLINNLSLHTGDH